MDEKGTKPKTLTGLACDYEVDVKTLRKWLVIAGLLVKGERRKSYTFTPLELETIYSKIGKP